MVEVKVVVGTKSGKSYNLVAKEDTAAVFTGKHIGDVVNVTPLGLKGYEVKITGGSDKCGFPMRKDAHYTGRGKALMASRTCGYRPDNVTNGVRVRKTVSGDMVSDDISQINAIVVKEGHDSIEKLLGLEKPAEAAPAEGAKAEEKKAEAPKAEAPKEHKAEAPKEHKEAPKA